MRHATRLFYEPDRRVRQKWRQGAPVQAGTAQDWHERRSGEKEKEAILSTIFANYFFNIDRLAEDQVWVVVVVVDIKLDKPKPSQVQ